MASTSALLLRRAVRSAAALALAPAALAIYVSDESRRDGISQRVRHTLPFTLAHRFPHRHPTVLAESGIDVARIDAARARERLCARVEGLTDVSAEQVRACGRGAKRVLVTFGDGVYDVTPFVESHPGGDHMLLAAGGALEPYWKVYAQHEEMWVYEMLEEMRVGNLVADDEWREARRREHVGNGKAAYAAEPERSDKLVVRSERPFNAETRADLLVATQITANDAFYVRNHMGVPYIREQDYELSITGVDGESTVRVGLDELKQLRKHSVCATIQCAGNRRSEFDAVKKVQGGRWDVGAIGNAEWSGATLNDVLQLAERKGGQALSSNDAQHVCFAGLDEDAATGRTYEASIPMDVVERAKHVLLAYEMNGEELPRDHGFPLRAVVPGVVGARNVKWVGAIKLSKEESESHWQRRDYRTFPIGETVDSNNATSIQELPVVSAICAYSYIDGEILAHGYAWSGDGKSITRVDVSADNGKTWTSATLLPKQCISTRNIDYEWTRWSAKLIKPVKDDIVVPYLVCRAIDSAQNGQPESLHAIWNSRGLVNNAWHRVSLFEVDTTTRVDNAHPRPL